MDLSGIESMSKNGKQPQPGEYWQHKVHTNDRVYFIGRTPDGEMVWQCDGDTIEASNLDWSGWEHLPDCTGWHWQPEVFPQYWTAFNNRLYAYLLRFSAEKYRMIRRDGSCDPDSNWYLDSSRGRKLLTKDQAEALIQEPESPAELPKPFTPEELTASYQSIPVADLPPVEAPTNQHLCEMIVNLRDQMDAMTKRMNEITWGKS